MRFYFEIQSTFKNYDMEYSIILPQKALRESLLIRLFELSKPVYRALFKRKTQAWRLKRKDLQKFEEYSLGKELYYFLEKNNFEIEEKLEKHDIGHVLLGYELIVEDEISMQFFFLSSGKRSIYCIFTIILGSLILPEYYLKYQKAYKRGKLAINFHKWKFEYLLHENINELRSLIFKEITKNPLYI